MIVIKLLFLNREICEFGDTADVLTNPKISAQKTIFQDGSDKEGKTYDINQFDFRIA